MFSDTNVTLVNPDSLNLFSLDICFLKGKHLQQQNDEFITEITLNSS